MTFYGQKRDYRKIDILVSGEYRGTTTWARTLQEAVKKYKEQYPDAVGVVAVFTK